MSVITIMLSLYDTAISLLHPQAANFFMSGQAPVITGNAHPNITPYDAFPTKTKQVFLAVGNDAVQNPRGVGTL